MYKIGRQYLSGIFLEDLVKIYILWLVVKLVLALLGRFFFFLGSFSGSLFGRTSLLVGFFLIFLAGHGGSWGFEPGTMIPFFAGCIWYGGVGRANGLPGLRRRVGALPGGHRGQEVPRGGDQ